MSEREVAVGERSVMVRDAGDPGELPGYDPSSPGPSTEEIEDLLENTGGSRPAGLLARSHRRQDHSAEDRDHDRLAASDENSDHPMRALAGLLERAGQTYAAIAVWEPVAHVGNTSAMRTADLRCVMPQGW